MSEAIDNWAKARATSKREKVPNKHLTKVTMMMVILVKVVMMVRVLLTRTTM